MKNGLFIISSNTDVKKSNALPIFLICFFLYLPFAFDYGLAYRFIDNVDFPSFYWAAKLVFGSGVSPYGPHVFDNAELLLQQEIFPYLYPPPSLLLFYPFTLMDYGTAKRIMLLLNHSVLLFFAYLFLVKLLDLDLKKPLGAAIFFFCFVYILSFYPLVITLNHGQINLIVLTLICLCWYAVKIQAREIYAAIPLAAAILLKTYPVLFLPLLLFNRKYRALAWTLGLVAAVTLLAYAILPPAVWGDWVAHVLPSGGYGNTPYGLFLPSKTANQSINGFTLRLFVDNEFNYAIFLGQGLETRVPYLLAAIVAGTTLGLCYLAARKRDKTDSLDLQFSLTLLMMFLVAPLSWEHHLVFALPGIFIMTYRLFQARQRYVLSTLAAPAAILLAWDAPFTFPSLGGQLLAVLAQSFKLYAVLVFWLIGITLLYRQWRLASTVADKPEKILQTGTGI